MSKLFQSLSENEDTSRISFNLPNIGGSNNGITFNLNNHYDYNNTEPEKKKTTSRKKKVSESAVTETISSKESSNNIAATNLPYEVKYKESSDLLKVAIGQLDGILSETINDANIIRASKTLKRKYDLLSLLNSNASNIIGNKITAIREINNIINKCNDLELKRMKELNLAANNEDSDKKIMDLYNAFISMPVGTGVPNGMPDLNQISHSISMGNVITATTSNPDDTAGYQNYLNNMNPSQRLGMYQNNPNIQQVVVYNQQDGSRYFEVMDISTGEVINGVDKHDTMFLEGVTLDLERKIARNTDLGETYPIVIVGEPIMNVY